MGSVRRHRRTNSDSESLQFFPRPLEDGDAMTFGPVPFGEYDSNGLYDLLGGLDYCEPEYFWPNIETYEFRGPCKI